MQLALFKTNKKLKIAVVVSQWNKTITEGLFKDTFKTLIKHGVKESNISKFEVPGSFELIFSAKKLGKLKKIDAIIVIGCIIKGETPHFEYISKATFNALMYLAIQNKKQIGNGIITALNKSQAVKRCGISNLTKSKGKGFEAAMAVIEVFKNVSKS